MDGNRSHEGAINQLEETLQCSERTVWEYFSIFFSKKWICKFQYKNLVEAIYRAMPDFTKEHTQEGSTNQFDARDDQAAKKKMLKERKKVESQKGWGRAGIPHPLSKEAVIVSGNIHTIMGLDYIVVLTNYYCLSFQIPFTESL